MSAGRRGLGRRAGIDPHSVGARHRPLIPRDREGSLPDRRPHGRARLVGRRLEENVPARKRLTVQGHGPRDCLPVQAVTGVATNRRGEKQDHPGWHKERKPPPVEGAFDDRWGMASSPFVRIKKKAEPTGFRETFPVSLNGFSLCNYGARREFGCQRRIQDEQRFLGTEFSEKLNPNSSAGAEYNERSQVRPGSRSTAVG